MPSGRERRVSPRKDCIVPIRFRLLPTLATAGRFSAAVDAEERLESPYSRRSNLLSAVSGETVNLSERGVYFRSRHSVSVGQPIEMFLTLPRELTGRSPEEVCCSALVVRVEDHADQQGFTGVGAYIERFDPVNVSRNWAN
jgi:PilZ domain